jgi:hypothetical protein
VVICATGGGHLIDSDADVQGELEAAGLLPHAFLCGPVRQMSGNEENRNHSFIYVAVPTSMSDSSVDIET